VWCSGGQPAQLRPCAAVTPSDALAA